MEARPLLDAFSDAVLLHDLSGRILEGNAAACERLGYTRAELRALRIVDVSAPDQAASVTERVEEAFRRGSMVYETVFVARDGKAVPTEVNCRVIEYGEQPAVLSVARDISERQEARASLRRRVDELAALSRLGRCVADSLSVAEIGRAALRELVASVELDVAMLFLAEEKELHLLAVHPADEALRKVTAEQRHVGQCLCGLAARDRQAVYSADVLNDSRCALAECKAMGLRSLAAFPLVQSDALVGVLTLASRTPRDFGASGAFLETLAGQVAAGLGNALLHRSLSQHAAELEARIEELNRADAALREREQFLQAVFDGIRDGISVLDRDLTVLRVNDWMEQQYAHRAPLVGRKCYEVYQCRETPCPWCPSRLVLDTGEPATEVVPFPSAEAPTGWIELSAFPLRDGEGRVTGIIEHVKDITQRKRAEQALLLERDLLARITETSPEGIAVIDRTGRIAFANQAAERILGLKRDAISRRAYNDPAWKITDHTGQPIPDEELPFHRVQESLGPVYDVRHAIERPDGRRVLLSINAAPLRDAAGAFDGMVATVTDVSERQTLEDQLRQAQKMEAVGRLAGGIAHDFNNQLTVVKGYCDMLLRMGDRPAEEQSEVQEIRAAAERAERLTRQLLAFSRKQALHPEATNLNETLREMENPLARLIGEDVHLSIITDASLGNTRVDRAQFQQAVMNLAINARDAMPGGGRLTIETANVDLNEDYAYRHTDAQAGAHVMVAVSDTGKGMDARTVERIFEPFFTTKEVGSGTGLGLSMVYGFVRQSGGSIHVYSEPGLGATFKVYLPRVVAPAGRPELTSPAERELGGEETILVVEDEAAVREVIVRSLRRNGYHVLAADGPAEALRIVEGQSDPIHLLLSDVVMPGMNGPELAGLLCAARPEMNVLYVSGYAENTIVHHGLLEKGVALLPKPFHPRDLARRVREVLDARP